MKRLILNRKEVKIIRGLLDSVGVQGRNLRYDWVRYRSGSYSSAVSVSWDKARHPSVIIHWDSYRRPQGFSRPPAQRTETYMEVEAFLYAYESRDQTDLA